MNKISQAAEEFASRRMKNERGGRLEESIRPQNLDEALAVQAKVTEILKEKTAAKVGGWKCLLPPEDKLIVGPIYSDIIYDHTETCPILEMDGEAAVEPELAFVFKESLPKKETPYTEDEVYAAIGEVRLAFELIRSRYLDTSDCEFPELLADGLFNQGIYLGPVVSDTPAEIKLTVTTSESEKTLEGKHPNNNARIPLTWFVNFLNSHDMQIDAGQAVITGSYKGVVRLPMNETVTVAYDGLGELKTRFVAR